MWPASLGFGAQDLLQKGHEHVGVGGLFHCHGGQQTGCAAGKLPYSCLQENWQSEQDGYQDW